jgi:hypothetical protein
MTTKLDEMWAALEAHEPDASYADAWTTMLKERTCYAAWAAYRAAPAGSAAAWAASMAVAAAVAVAVAEEAEWAGGAAWADRYAQIAIDALREVKP